MFDSEPRVSGGTFLKLEPGESVVGILKGKTKDYYAKWNGQGYEDSVPEDGAASFRFKVNFIRMNADENLADETVIWEQGATVYNFLKEMNADYPLDKTFIKIKRNGTGIDTTYTLLPSTKIKYSVHKAHIEAVELKSLEAQNAAGDSSGADEVPF